MVIQWVLLTIPSRYSYFDPSLPKRLDGIDSFRNFLLPVTGLVHVSNHFMEKVQDLFRYMED